MLASHTCSGRAACTAPRTRAPTVKILAASERHAPAAEPALPRDQVSRRALLACATTLPALAALPLSPPSSSAAEEFKTLRDDILAYQFDYPVATLQGRQLPLVLSRKPEKYSSAAPLTADARQRIVAELVDLIDSVTVSVTVGPPGALLRGLPPSEWAPRAVAEQVLIDRSTGRITSGQRISLSTVESLAVEERDGARYVVYEHISQGSPTLRNPSLETYRRALAVTAVRAGKEGTPYLYTLNLSCPNELWQGLELPFRRSVESFRLLQPGPNYVAPDQNPFLFF